MSDPKPKKAPKPKQVQAIHATYTKEGGESSQRQLLTVDSLQPATMVLALDVSAMLPDKVQAVRDLYQGYQQAVAEHMSAFPTFADWAASRGIPDLQFKSFKIAGLKDAVLT